jgi:hypothetical protein
MYILTKRVMEKYPVFLDSFSKGGIVISVMNEKRAKIFERRKEAADLVKRLPTKWKIKKMAI